MTPHDNGLCFQIDAARTGPGDKGRIKQSKKTHAEMKSYEKKVAKDSERGDVGLAERKVKNEQAATEIVEKWQADQELTTLQKKFLETGCGKLLVLRACKEAGVDEGTIAEMYAISAKTGRGERLRINKTTGKPEQIEVDDPVSLGSRKHVTEGVGNLYGVNKKEEETPPQIVINIGGPMQDAADKIGRRYSVGATQGTDTGPERTG